MNSMLLVISGFFVLGVGDWLAGKWNGAPMRSGTLSVYGCAVYLTTLLFIGSYVVKD